MMARLLGAAAAGLALSAGLLVAPAGATTTTPHRSLYVSGLVTRNVSIFGVRPGGGLDGPPATVDTGGGTRGIVLAPDGRTAYVAVGFDPGTGQDADKVTTFR